MTGLPSLSVLVMGEVVHDPVPGVTARVISIGSPTLKRVLLEVATPLIQNVWAIRPGAQPKSMMSEK